MKIIKLLTGVVFILLLIQGFGYLNLMESEKYETQPEGITEITKEVQEQVEKRAVEIEKQKRKTIIYSIVLFCMLIALIVIWAKSASEDKSNPTIKESKE
ncbi:MAG: hypothetical protein AB2L20_24330 [Mangrovibacterium sp.]